MFSHRPVATSRRQWEWSSWLLVHTLPSTFMCEGDTIESWVDADCHSLGKANPCAVLVLRSKRVMPAWYIMATHRLPSGSNSRSSEPFGCSALSTGSG